jgi:hypothetical protein
MNLYEYDYHINKKIALRRATYFHVCEKNRYNLFNTVPAHWGSLCSLRHGYIAGRRY